MNKNRFHILKSVLAAYNYIGREWRYLFGIGLVPASVSFLTIMLSQALHPKAGLIEEFLWSLPATALFGWLMFQQTRLMLFGERLDNLKTDVPFVLNRQRLMRASIIVWILFKMAIMGAGIFLYWAASTATPGETSVQSVIGMLLIGFAFWGVRFGVAHILAAADYSIRAFIFRVNGIMISLRLIALAFLATAPLMLILRALISLVVPGGEVTATTQLSGLTFALLALLGTLMALASTLVLNAAAIFALKEMLGQDKAGAA